MTMAKPAGATILLVEDDAAVAESVAEVLETAGYKVVRAPTGLEAKASLEQVRPDLIILDLILPDVDGLILCSDLKAIADCPIIVSSATGRKRDTVLSLKLGADDFVAKPFDIFEMEARVEAVLRRAQQQKTGSSASAGRDGGGQPDEIRLGDLSIDRSRRRVMLGGTELHLTPIEYRLLTVLASRPDEVLSREDLAQLVWGYQDASVGRTVDVHVRRLRVKLASAPVPPPPIISVRGFGYKISTDETAANGALGAAS
jgi:two-component system response regulator MtrA